VEKVEKLETGKQKINSNNEEDGPKLEPVPEEQTPVPTPTPNEQEQHEETIQTEITAE
jgi:hypothetical protein